MLPHILDRRVSPALTPNEFRRGTGTSRPRPKAYQPRRINSTGVAFNARPARWAAAASCRKARSSPPPLAAQCGDSVFLRVADRSVTTDYRSARFGDPVESASAVRHAHRRHGLSCNVQPRRQADHHRPWPNGIVKDRGRSERCTLDPTTSLNV